MRKLLFLGLLVIGATAHAGDPEAGKAKSGTCVACHGPNGISANPIWPNLAGQQQQYLVIAMKAYRDGGRTDPLMSPMARPLSDQDIADLAAYYSSLPADGGGG